MGQFLHELIGTVLLRPYVFAFLIVYMFGCTASLGLRRALLFCAAGYLIAWLTELSSIHNGFPYGPYYYIESTRGAELWVLGVPFMDSLSYVFLAYASYSVALMIACPLKRYGWMLYALETHRARQSFYTAALGAVLFVYLDIIIDPVALKGEKWFLGQIYGYAETGAYFGVPLTNFGGWLLTGFLMMRALQKIDLALGKAGVSDTPVRYAWRFMTGPALYVSVVAFNLAVAFAIGEYTIAWAGVFIMLLPAVLFAWLVKARLSTATAADLETHLKDFPHTIPSRRAGAYRAPI